jgi:hypothetical protein
MKKPKNLKLSIPEPCSQNWNYMTSAEVGRHCDNCEKTVIDFSTFTDRELVEFFKKATGKICGRLNQYQVDRPMPVTEQSRHSHFHRAIFGTALVAGIAASADGQIHTQSVTPVQVPIPSTPTGQVKMGEIKIPAKEQHTIHGVVRDSKTKQPLVSAEVFVEKIDSVVYTDSNGVFTLSIPDSLIGKKIKVLFSASGYATVEREIKASNSVKHMDIAMKPEAPRPFMGDISY